MSLLRTQFPRDSSPRPARNGPLGYFELLVRILMLNDGLSRSEALARVRADYPFLKEATMTTEYVELTKMEIESEVVARTYDYILERKLDREKDYIKAHHAVLDDDPALKVAYAG